MDLEEYRLFKALTYDELADFLELKRSTVYNICKGIGCITLANAHRIMNRTHGRVGYEDLLTHQEEC